MHGTEQILAELVVILDAVDEERREAEHAAVVVAARRVEEAVLTTPVLVVRAGVRLLEGADEAGAQPRQPAACRCGLPAAPASERSEVSRHYVVGFSGTWSAQARKKVARSPHARTVTAWQLFTDIVYTVGFCPLFSVLYVDG